MLKISKIIALILCISLASVFAHEFEMKFLEDQESNQENSLFEFEGESLHEHELRDFTPENAKDFALGYLEGVELFNNVLNSTCLENGEVIVEDAFKLYNLLKDLKIDTHIITNVKEIILATQSIVSHFKQEDEQCKAAAELALNDIKRVGERVAKDGYVKELGSHTWNNVGEIEEMVKNGLDNFNGGNMHESGNHFGRVTKFVAFWDL